MSETDSLFSTTATLYDVPTLRGDYSSGLIPIEDCFLVLFIDHEKFKVDVGQFTRAGLPAVYDRISEPSGSQNTLAKMNLKKKRLQVQFPRECLQHARIERKAPITTLEQLRMIEANRRSSRGRMKTMFDSLENDLVGVQTRVVLDVALSILFRGIGINSPLLFYPPQSVLVTPRWAVSKDGATATSPAQWATISFISPSEIDSGETKQEAEKRYLDSVKVKETEEEILQRLFIPSQRSEEMLHDLLYHLENRGAIWQKAGQATLPSIKNKSPQDRPEFVVLGLFPKAFIERCKEYHRKGVPMPEDTTEKPKSKVAPLITTNSDTSIHSTGKSSAESAPEANDFLKDWTVRIASYEPYQTGSVWQDGAVGFGMGGAMMAGGF